MNFVEILDNFHFIRPWVLLAMAPLVAMLFLLRRQARAQSGWQGILASHLYDNLVSTEASQKSRPPWLLLFAGWLLTCVALAGPTWEKLPQPVYQVSQGKVILMDMSMSMRAEDIKPNRLSRVRFKAMDLLAELREGETGLVAYAGDAFVISPLTTDVQNLETLIPSLSPEIMPLQGSDAVYALETTYELLQNAGYQTGDVFWITDGIDMTEVAPIRNLMEAHDFRLNIMAVGTEDGAPIKITNGNFLKDRSGAVVIPRLRTASLESIARSSGGRFVISRPDDADIAYLAEPRLEPQESKDDPEDGFENSFGDQWKEFGPWVLLLLLPIAAYGFRRGILPIFLLLLLFDTNTAVYANDNESDVQTQNTNAQNIDTPAEQSNSWLNNFWQTPNQKGAESFGEEDFQAAAQQFEDPMWKGLSHFEAGDYQQAAEVYSGMDTPDGNFSLGNALAQTQQYPEAIAAYERVLELDPDYPNAAENKQYLEDLMDEQQQQDQQQNSDENQDNQEQQDSDQQQEQQGESQENESEQQESESQQQDQQGSEQQNSEQEQQQDQSEQQQEQSEPQESENMQEQEAQEQQQQSEEQQDAEEMQQQQAQMQEQEELTDEQKEQLQKIENWLRKVPDDPAYLLKRKMLLEQQRRKRLRMPALEQKDW